jgi:uncharacterized coiled-coil DUF342 family protein
MSEEQDEIDRLKDRIDNLVSELRDATDRIVELENDNNTLHNAIDEVKQAVKGL